MEVASLYATLGLKPDTAGWAKGNALLSGMKKALAAVAAYQAFGWIKGTITGVVALGDKLNTLSATVGTNVVALQELGYAAEQNGSSLDGMGAGLRSLGRSMQGAKTGGGEMAKTFRKAGVVIKDSHGKMLPVEKVLGNVANAMAKMKDPTERSALAMKVLGRGGAALAPLLSKGGVELARLRGEAQDLGGVIDADGTKKLGDLGDAVNRTKFAIEGLKNRAVVAIAPALLKVVDGITAWIKANREMIDGLGIAAMKAFAVAAKVVAFALKQVVAVFDWLGKHPKIAKALLMAIGIVVGVIVAKFMLLWVAGKLVIAAIIVAITALILVMRPVVEWIIEAVKTIWEWIKQVAAGFMASMRRIGTWASAILAAFKRVKQFVIDTRDRIVEAFADAWEKIKAGAKAMGEFIIDLPVIKQLRELGTMLGGAARDIARPEQSLGEAVKPKAERSFMEDLVNFGSGGALDRYDSVKGEVQKALGIGSVSITNKIDVKTGADAGEIATASANATRAALENFVRGADSEVR